jgi:hypothetical protein
MSTMTSRHNVQVGGLARLHRELGGENTRGPKYYAAAGEPKAIWKVPGSRHTGGMDARPAEYERRVIDFFDRSLLDSGATR